MRSCAQGLWVWMDRSEGTLKGNWKGLHCAKGENVSSASCSSVLSFGRPWPVYYSWSVHEVKPAHIQYSKGCPVWASFIWCFCLSKECWRQDKRKSGVQQISSANLTFQLHAGSSDCFFTLHPYASTSVCLYNWVTESLIHSKCWFI